MKRNMAITWGLVALVVIAATGYSLGRRSMLRSSDGERVTSGTDALDHGRLPKAGSRAVIPARLAPSVLPADLDGKDFVAAMPELERRARGGDAEATRLLFHRLQECSSYQVEDDAAIRKRVDEWYERQRDMEKRYPRVVEQTGHATTEDAYKSELKRGIDLRDRCTALTPQQIGNRIDWARLALSRHDRRMIIEFAGIGYLSFSGVERVRYVDRIIDLAGAEQTELTRLAENGDLDAIARAAHAYSSQFNKLLPDDLLQAYAYAYAWRLANGADDKWNMDVLMAGLAASRLSAQQVDEARTSGQALYQRCCKHIPQSASE